MNLFKDGMMNYDTLYNSLLLNSERTCLLNNKYQYKDLLNLIDYNSILLRKYQDEIDNSHLTIVIDIEIGWKFIPILLSAFKVKATILPIDVNRKSSGMVEVKKN